MARKPVKPAAAPRPIAVPRPTSGGSFIRDKATGELIPRERAVTPAPTTEEGK